MIPVELQDAFYTGRRGDVVKFVINDSVEVTSGEHEGCVGAIISVEEVEPAVVYLVERTDNGSSIFVPQSCLKLLEGEASLTNRGKVLQELIEFRRKPTEMHAILEAFEWDLEKELVQLEKETGLSVYFADPYAAWQRGTNENTNGLLRFYFPKGTNFHAVTEDELEQIIKKVNHRPRKRLNYQTPHDVFFKNLRGALAI